MNWRGLKNLILVAGHAVYTGEDFSEPDADRNWLLLPFQRGEPPFYIEHIRAGVGLAAQDPRSLLVFSGGQSREEAGPRSESQGYWNIANHFHWWSSPETAQRATTEEFAGDSLENLLFGICRFKECAERYPESILVVSWAFKEERFAFHRDTIRLAQSAFVFKGVNQPPDLPGAQKGESQAMADFRSDPYGTGAKLAGKRDMRNPFKRYHDYSKSCPELVGLLNHRGPELYSWPLPWQHSHGK